MKRIILAVAVVLGALAVAGVASNVTQAEGDYDDKCYDTVTVEKIDKQTRTITKVKDGVAQWSEWTDWGAPPVWDDGRPRGPLPHNDVTPGMKGYREYRYAVVGSKQVKVEVECPPEETTTTTLPEETTTTTVPIDCTTGVIVEGECQPVHPDPTPPRGNDCLMDDGTRIPLGQYVEGGDSTRADIGTTEEGAQPCGRVPVIVPGEPAALPETK